MCVPIIHDLALRSLETLQGIFPVPVPMLDAEHLISVDLTSERIISIYTLRLEFVLVLPTVYPHHWVLVRNVLDTSKGLCIISYPRLSSYPLSLSSVGQCNPCLSIAVFAGYAADVFVCVCRKSGILPLCLHAKNFHQIS